MKKCLSIVMVLALMLGLVPILPVSAVNYTYDADAAVAYAKAHYNDGKGLCAEFVSDCLKAGGFTAVYNVRASTLGRQLQSYGTKITCSGWSSSSCLKASMFNGTLSKGDVIIWENVSGSSSSGHAMLYSGENNSSGQILVYAHNRAKNKEVIKPSAQANTVYAIRLPSAKDTVAPSISNIKITNKTSTGYRVSCTVSDNVGVTRVRFPTWTDTGWQDDLVWHEGVISGNTAYFDVSVSDHNNEAGLYRTHIYVYDKAGNELNVDAGDIIVPKPDKKAPEIYDMEISNVTTNGYRVTCKISDDIGVTRIQFPTWTDYQHQDDIKWYECN